MNYPLSKYRYYQANNRVIAVSTYAGRTVKASAKCAESDTFSLETGKLLAAARCNEKVSAKRVARANMKVKQAEQDLIKAQKHLEDMKQYLNDAVIAYNDAGIETDKIIESLKK